MLKRLAWIWALGFPLASLGADSNDIWVEDFNNAKQVARQQSKDLLILFTGTDWCPRCKKLDAEVLSKEEFRKDVAKDYVLVKLDFPQTHPQSDAIRRQNERLKADFEQKYRFGVYPSVYLADANGVPYAHAGYEEVGVEKYLLYLAFLRRARNMVDPGSEWIEDMTVVLAKADYLHKDILMFFTGSDWCPYCMQLDKQVLSQDLFKKEASKEFLFLKLDYPRTKPQDPKIKAQNQKLNDLFASKFNLQGFPSIYLADSEGAPYARTGLNDMGPKAYSQHLGKLRADHIKDVAQGAGADPNSRPR